MGAKGFVVALVVGCLDFPATARLFKDGRLQPGARIEIRITAPETIGKILRPLHDASREAPCELCDPPGRERPGRC